MDQDFYHRWGVSSGPFQMTLLNTALPFRLQRPELHPRVNKRPQAAGLSYRSRLTRGCWECYYSLKGAGARRWFTWPLAEPEGAALVAGGGVVRE